MKTRRRLTIGPGLVGLALVAIAAGGGLARATPGATLSAAEAETPPTPQPGESRAQMKERLMEQALEQMRVLRVWKVTEELKLDEETAAKLFPLLAGFDDRVRPLGRERHLIQRALRNELGRPNPDEAHVEQLIDQLTANRRQRLALDEERLRATRAVLTPVQQAKLMLILPRIEDDFRRRIRKAMGGGRRGRGEGGGSPQGGAGPPGEPQAPSYHREP